ILLPLPQAGGVGGGQRGCVMPTPLRLTSKLVSLTAPPACGRGTKRPLPTPTPTLACVPLCSIASGPVRAAPPIGVRDIRPRESGAGKGLQDERNDGSTTPGEQGRPVADVVWPRGAARRGRGLCLAY